MSQNQEKISLQSLIDLIPGRKCGLDCIGLSGSEKAYFASRLYREYNLPLVVIVPSSKDADRFQEDLRFFLNQFTPPLSYFPPYNILPFKYLSYQNETAAERIRVLYRLIECKEPPFVVTTPDALLQKIIPKQEICNYAELLMAGEELDRDFFIEKLISGGYSRTATVEEPGDFCIRGGILDVFSPLYSDPLRIELFGDTVDALRFFSATDQRKTQSIQEAVILPAREAIVNKERLDQIINRIRKQASVLDLPVTKVRGLVDQIKREGVCPGIESLISIIYPDLDTLFDYIPNNALFVLVEPDELEAAAEKLWEQASKNFVNARAENRLCVEPHNLYINWSKAKDVLLPQKPVAVKTLSMMPGGFEKKQNALQFDFKITGNVDMREELERHREKDNLFLPLANWIDDSRRSGNVTLIVCSTRFQGDRLKSLLAPYGIQLQFVDGFPDLEQSDKDFAYVCLGQVSSGFIWPVESLAMITEDEIFGTKHRKRRKPKLTVPTEPMAWADLKKGDLVVHIEHGIGRYEGLVKLKVDSTANDYLLIIYKDNDKLYLPADRLGMVDKYMGVDGITPVIDKLGGNSWQRAKNKVKKMVEKIAEELLKLYAERRVVKGHAFSRPDDYFQDFEAGFAYDETQDQLKAIEAVLRDMAEPTPMDRLICGDVGYGKTEVALRASFMAANDGKQVAVLVPTTVLAEQHFTTFSKRLEHYPVNIACLSRFRPKKEQHKIINDLKAGQIDIVIGTHRLLQKDVVFKDLGLIVLDEEQRFGVNHKEKLKKIRKTVDVLALTATPIPRTLHMSLMGMRDINVISTPPEHRHAIVTYICKFDDAVVSEAIRNELKRGGQIFFVHNNIHNIWAVAKKLQKLVPEVRLDVAHGRLQEDELEQVMLSFVRKEIDMLVCTTIIEAGLDIPSANTILVNRADRFGLAQMYQLRGRVGRADEQAYAYLFIPDGSALGKDAQKRMKVLMEYSDLGSGFQIAMSDLKIRGGGNILGMSQSGHIAAVGYDMFLKLMENAVSELKGEPIIDNLEPEINVSMSAFIPESYMPDIDQRLAAYRRLSKITELNDLADFNEELIDRYGPLPIKVTNLLLKIMLKVLSIKAGVRRLDLVGPKLILYFSEAHQKNPFGIVDMIVSEQERFEFTPDHILKVKLSKTRTNELLVQTKNILKEIAQRVNEIP